MENIIKNLQLIEDKNHHIPKVDVISIMKGIIEMLNFRINTLEKREVVPDLLINQIGTYKISDLQGNVINQNKVKFVKFDYIRNTYIFRIVDFILIGNDSMEVKWNFIETPINCYPLQVKNNLQYQFKFEK